MRPIDAPYPRSERPSRSSATGRPPLERDGLTSDRATGVRARRQSILAALGMLATLAPVACGFGGDAGPASVARDSAGIRIVENAAPVWAGDEGWWLPMEPVVDIGVVDGEPEYRLSGVADATRFEDGRIAVASSQTNDIRVYGPDGGFLLAMGGGGGGPGEFRRLSAVDVWPGDTVVGFDASVARITLFSRDGEPARTVRLESMDDGRIGWAARLPDGRHVAGTSPTFAGARRAPGTVVRDTTPIVVYTADGSLVDTLGMFPATEVATWSMGERRAVGWPPFGRRRVQAVHDGTLFLGTQETFEVRAYSPDGRMTRIIRAPSGDRPISEADLARLREAMIADVGHDMPVEQMTDQYLANAPRPDTRPAYGRLLVDARGHLWVADEDGILETEPTRWTVFDPEGRMLGTVEVPDHFHVYEVGEDYVLGRWRDEFEVEHVRLYRLLRNRR